MRQKEKNRRLLMHKNYLYAYNSVTQQQRFYSTDLACVEPSGNE